MKIKPCPFCGYESMYFDFDQGTKWGRVKCSCCGAEGPEVRTLYNISDIAPWHDEAIHEWNIRKNYVRAEVAKRLAKYMHKKGYELSKKYGKVKMCSDGYSNFCDKQCEQSCGLEYERTFEAAQQAKQREEK